MSTRTPNDLRREQPTDTMTVQTSRGEETRKIDHVLVNSRHQAERLQPALRDGEIARYTIGGECIVINTGRRSS